MKKSTVLVSVLVIAVVLIMGGVLFMRRGTTPPPPQIAAPAPAPAPATAPATPPTVPPSAKGEIVIGVQCDRTGPTQIVGTVLCPGFHDYIALVNSRGGVEGHKIKDLEIDHEYKVPPAVESYERFKKEGAVSMAVYGTPQIYALAAKLTEDRIPGTSPGFGSAAAADGERNPYIFPIAATYWSQGAAAVDFVKKQLGGSLKGKKIAYIFYDNPAGREPIQVIEDLAAKEGFELKQFAVPPPGVEMGAQVLDIAQRFRADFVVAHLFGGAPAVSIKEFKRVGYPLNKVVSFVWGSAEANIDAAGGFPAAEGYYTMQFAGVGQDYPVLNEIREMYKKEGKPAPKEMASTVFYNRGVLIAALHVEAIRNAVKAHPDGKITGADVKAGFEKISGFTLGGLVPPLKITASDHEGGGLVQIWQVKGGKFVKMTDWYSAYGDVVAKHIKEAATKS
jgi:branched-chain amino acid transport system substrate-binding protein